MTAHVLSSAANSSSVPEHVMMSAFINNSAGGWTMTDFPERAKRVGVLPNEHADGV
jgi:hypothetical protein